jgi:biotin transport system substrate-specific component
MKLKPREITSSAVFAVLTAIGAWISMPLPITPVPFTLQVFFVLLSGAVLGGMMGALAQVMYLLLGLIGFPVFAGGESGPGVLIGPTGGYLVGFVFGAYVTGRIAQELRSPRLVWMALATTLGLIPIYTLGEIGLWIWVRSSFPLLLMAGVIPFLPGDIIKAVVAAFVATRRHLRQLIPQ